ncbi:MULTISPECIES: hypothetical protein [unclassified Haladaptatus]|uniref:hypothetical protein n=1 Tax=unclassified Haladaptatus TaxID=2622732 RepID=UPI000AAC7DFC|nr:MULTISPECIES: hypothetical protein [unclassified Haladaptatus]MCO8243866.1 hypothetical protein [Haladaptatus sp. AB643]MCO8253480.1 hypothetical protein [Haladaptatus sp. AB618]
MTDDNQHREPTTDGGRSNREKRTMAEISHTPPYEAPDASRVFERGGELLTEPTADAD